MRLKGEIISVTAKAIICAACLAGSAILHSQRQVGVVFDNSGSMNGDPCIYTNYSLKLIIALLEPGTHSLHVTRQDDMSARRIDLGSRSSEINRVDWPCQNGGIYWKSISNTVDALDAASNKDTWLVLITDGLIDYGIGTDYQSNIKEFANNGGKILWVKTLEMPLKVTGTGLSRFLKFSVPSSQVDIFETNAKAERLLEQLGDIAAILINADPNGVQKTMTGNQIVINLKLPAHKFIVIEQNSNATKTAALLDIEGPSGVSLNNYYSLPLDYEYLFGCVHHVNKQPGSKTIQSGEYILRFNENMEGRNIKILPIVSVKPSLKIEGNTLSSIDQNVYKICKDENTVIIRMDFRNEEGSILDEEVLKELNVTARFGDNQKRLSRVGNAFQVEIPLSGEETSITITSSLPGYFTYNSEVYKILKKDCGEETIKQPAEPTPSKPGLISRWFAKDSIKVSGKKPKPEKEKMVSKERTEETENVEILPDTSNLKIEQLNASVRITELEKAPAVQVYPVINGETIGIDDIPGLQLVQVDGSGLRMEIKRQGDFWIVKPYKIICPCLAKTGKYVIQFELRSRDPNLLPVKSATIEYEIIDVGFWEKCGRAIITLLLSMAGLIYLYGIVTKPRFSRAGQINYSRVSDDEDDDARIRHAFLRNRGLRKWMARWFLPFTPEKSSLTIYNHRIGFIANKNKHSIILPKEYQSDRVYIHGSKIPDTPRLNLKIREGDYFELREEHYKIHMQYKRN